MISGSQDPGKVKCSQECGEAVAGGRWTDDLRETQKVAAKCLEEVSTERQSQEKPGRRRETDRGNLSVCSVSYPLSTRLRFLLERWEIGFIPISHAGNDNSERLSKLLNATHLS